MQLQAPESPADGQGASGTAGAPARRRGGASAYSSLSDSFLDDREAVTDVSSSAVPSLPVLLAALAITGAACLCSQCAAGERQPGQRVFLTHQLSSLPCLSIANLSLAYACAHADVAERC